MRTSASENSVRQTRAARPNLKDWLTLTRRPRQPDKPGATAQVVDLFCGCGGLSLGAWEAFRRAGISMTPALALDLSNAALAVYKRNFAFLEPRTLRDDIGSVFDGGLGASPTESESFWSQLLGQVDLLLAGPPCQGHSDLNNSTRRRDPRNLLYLRAIRAVQVLRPAVAIIENVPAVVHDSDGVVAQGVSTLESMDYQISTGVVDAAHCGLPQRRRRHLLIASLHGTIDLQKVFSDTPGTLGSYIADIADEPSKATSIFRTPSKTLAQNIDRINYLFDNRIHDLPNALRPPCHRDKHHTYASMYGRLRANAPAPTITSGFGSMGQGRFVHPTRRRMITPHEAARIQGFPDFFDFSNVVKRTELQEMLGNAVPPPLALFAVESLIAGHHFQRIGDATKKQEKSKRRIA